MTRYRLSNHTLSIETGRYRQHWLPKESRICPYCTHEKLETEQHFLTSCPNYQHIRDTFYPKFETLCPDFKLLNKKTQIQYLLGEKQDCILLAARYINACHKRGRSRQSVMRPHTHTHTTPNVIFKLFINSKMLVCIFFFFLSFDVCMHACFCCMWICSVFTVNTMLWQYTVKIVMPIKHTLNWIDR